MYNASEAIMPHPIYDQLYDLIKHDQKKKKKFELTNNKTVVVSGNETHTKKASNQVYQDDFQGNENTQLAQFFFL